MILGFRSRLAPMRLRRAATRPKRALFHDGHARACQSPVRLKERKMTTETQGTTIDPAEVARFERIARTWWDAKGPMKTLPKFNPGRPG